MTHPDRLDVVQLHLHEDCWPAMDDHEPDNAAAWFRARCLSAEDALAKIIVERNSQTIGVAFALCAATMVALIVGFLIGINSAGYLFP